MIEVTTEAVEKLKSIMEDEEAEESALRVVVVPSGNGVQYMLTLESEQNEDDVLTVVDGVRVLIDADSAPIMQGGAHRLHRGPDAQRLHHRQPERCHRHGLRLRRQLRLRRRPLAPTTQEHKGRGPGDSGASSFWVSPSSPCPRP